MFESSVSFLFFFAHQVEVANRRICAREQFFPIFTQLALKSRREFVHTNKKEKIIEPQIDKNN